MKKIISSSFLVFLACTALANANEIPFEKSFPYTQARCRLGKSKINLSLRFHEKMDEPGDYMGGTLVYLKGSKTTNLESIDKGANGYNFVKPKEKSVCDKTQAYKINDHTMAILYRRDNRPTSDIFHVALVDIKTDELLEKKEIGAVDEYMPVENGFAFSTRNYSSENFIDMKSTYGRKLFASVQNLGALNVVKLDGNKLKIEINPDLTYTNSRWKKYFKTKEDFFKESGWDLQSKKFKKDIVYEGTYFNRKESDILESCMAFTDKMDSWEQSNLHCLKEKQ